MIVVARSSKRGAVSVVLHNARRSISSSASRSSVRRSIVLGGTSSWCGRPHDSWRRADRVFSGPAVRWCSGTCAQDAESVADTQQVNSFHSLAQTLGKIEAVSSRLEILNILSTWLAALNVQDPSAMLPAVRLAVGQLWAPYEGIELGVGDALILKAAAQVHNVPVLQLQAEAAATGDIAVAIGNRFSAGAESADKLGLQVVFDRLSQVAAESGAGSTARKQAILEQLFKSCTSPEELRFLVRLIKGQLRTGASDKTVLQAATMAICPQADKAAMNTVQQLFATAPDWTTMISALQQGGIEQAVQACHLRLGIPCMAMLAVPAQSIEEAVQAFAGSLGFTCEFKLDGERVQIHFGQDVAKVFSRNAEDSSIKYAEAVDHTVQARGPTQLSSFIVDGEAVAIDRNTGAVLPFQTLSTKARKSKKDGATTPQVDICVVAFDLLYMNGESLLAKPLSERRSLLKQHFVSVPGKFEFVTATDVGADASDTVSKTAVEEALMAAVSAGTEGVMIKGLDTTYTPGTRKKTWVKVKKDYIESLSGGDSLDVVPVAGYTGKGRRVGKYGSYVMAVYDSGTGVFRTLCKVGAGFTDEDLRTVGEELTAVPAGTSNQVPASLPVVVSSSLSPWPDVWFHPTQVWEVHGAELTLSPVHTAAASVATAFGYAGCALRFPRFIRKRPDKYVYLLLHHCVTRAANRDPKSATADSQVVSMLCRQRGLPEPAD